MLIVQIQLIIIAKDLERLSVPKFGSLDHLLRKQLE
jgi:hypothetical protein